MVLQRTLCREVGALVEGVGVFSAIAREDVGCSTYGDAIALFV